MEEKKDATDYQALIDFAKNYQRKDYQPKQSPCPSCGHCSTCGRGGHWTRPYYPWWQYPYQPYITYLGTNTTGGYAPTTTTGNAPYTTAHYTLTNDGSD